MKIDNETGCVTISGLIYGHVYFTATGWLFMPVCSSGYGIIRRRKNAPTPEAAIALHKWIKNCDKNIKKRLPQVDDGCDWTSLGWS